jgi:hypothetical protein
MLAMYGVTDTQQVQLVRDKIPQIIRAKACLPGECLPEEVERMRLAEGAALAAPGEGPGNQFHHSV